MKRWKVRFWFPLTNDVVFKQVIIMAETEESAKKFALKKLHKEGCLLFPDPRRTKVKNFPMTD